jgi:hypothetical protein
VVVGNEFLKLALYVGYFARRKLVLIEWHFCLLQVAQEAYFGRKEEEESFTPTTGTGSTSHTMDVLARIIWRVKLDDPINGWDVQATGSYVCAKEDTFLGIHKLEKRVCARGLVLLSLE